MGLPRPVVKTTIWLPAATRPVTEARSLPGVSMKESPGSVGGCAVGEHIHHGRGAALEHVAQGLFLDRGDAATNVAGAGLLAHEILARGLEKALAVIDHAQQFIGASAGVAAREVRMCSAPSSSLVSARITLAPCGHHQVAERAHGRVGGHARGGVRAAAFQRHGQADSRTGLALQISRARRPCGGRSRRRAPRSCACRPAAGSPAARWAPTPSAMRAARSWALSVSQPRLTTMLPMTLGWRPYWARSWRGHGDVRLRLAAAAVIIQQHRALDLRPRSAAPRARRSRRRG